VSPSGGAPSPRLTIAVRLVLVVFSAYHLVTGVVSVCFPEFSEVFYQKLYHFYPTMTEQYKLVLKPWGALAFFAGVMGFYAVWDPYRYRGVLVALVILLVTRVGYRSAFADELVEVFQIDKPRNAINTGLIAAEVVLFSVWLWRTRGVSSATEGGAASEPAPDEGPSP
jgi:hypothetical protein